MFIVPLSVLPFGWRFLSSWGQTLLWLQMWAPLYAILHYLILMTARSKSLAALSISSEAGVTIASSVGLVNANADLAAMAGYLAISIPFLAVALVKGVGSFVHMASHLGAVSQGAASMAAGEAVSGNYSFGNISEGNRQIANTNMLSHSTAASYKAGMFSQSDGRVDMVTTADGQQIVNVGSSSVPVSINKAETESAVLTDQSSRSYQRALQQSESSALHFGETLRGLEEVSRQTGHSENLSDQTSHGKSIEQSSAVSKVGQIVRDFARGHNLSEEQAASLIGQASIGGKAFGIEGKMMASIDGKATDQKTISEAYKIGQDEQFQKLTREAVQAVQNQSYTQNDEDSRRRSDSIGQSWENAQNLRTEASKSFRESEDLQKQASWIQSNASTINTNFTQQAIEGVANMPADNARGRIGMQGVAHMAAHNPELLQKYVSHWASHHGMNVPASPELNRLESAPELQQSYQDERRHGNELSPSVELSPASHLAIPRETRGLQTDETRDFPFLGSKDSTGPEISKSFVTESVAPYSEDRRESFLPLENPKGRAEEKTVLSSNNQDLIEHHGPGFRVDSFAQQRNLASTQSILTESKPVVMSNHDIKPDLTDTTSSSHSRVKKPKQMKAKESVDTPYSEGLAPQRIEALKGKVSSMQRTGAKSIEMAERQHEQQLQGLEKEFHKKGKKNLLRVAAKAEVKNLADTALGMPYEGAKTLVKKLTGESQKKP